MLGKGAQRIRLARQARILKRTRQSIRSLSSGPSVDFIILGAGSAGCVLSSRIARHSSRPSVLTLEAGTDGERSLLHSWKIRIPSALTYNLDDSSSYNWHYKTTPQPHLNGRCIEQPRGKTVGGSSCLNAMVYIRGHAEDYERWSKEIPNDGEIQWDYKSALPYFKRAQHSQTPIPPNPSPEQITSKSLPEEFPPLGQYKGFSGPLVVTNGSTLSKASGRSPLFDKFVEAAVDVGYSYTPDLNGYRQEGFGPMDQTVTTEGVRCSASEAYLRPLLGSSGGQNFELKDGCTITRILFDEKDSGRPKAIGVEYRNEKTKTLERAYARKEVISCLGSIGSPQVMMVSGVGPKEELVGLGIDVVHDSPGMGTNLQDHLEFYVQYKSAPEAKTLYPVGNWFPYPHKRIAVGAEWFLSGRGLAASNQFETGGFIRSRAGIKHPDLQYHFIPGAVVGQNEFLPYHAFQAHCGTMRPQSRGEVKIVSGDVSDSPLIDPAYFSVEQDRVDMRNGFKLTEEIIGSSAFDGVRGEALHAAEVDLEDDASIDEWIANKSHSAYHPCGTCAMGIVTDSAGRVQGLDSLRVVDASLMPSMPSGNLNAPTIMIAEKIADHIIGEQQQAKEQVEWFEHETWETSQR